MSMTTTAPISPAATPVTPRSSALPYQIYPYTSSNLAPIAKLASLPMTIIASTLIGGMC